MTTVEAQEVSRDLGIHRKWKVMANPEAIFNQATVIDGLDTSKWDRKRARYTVFVQYLASARLPAPADNVRGNCRRKFGSAG